ncbi:MAG TPA: putative lipid II flippase FtsW [Patescibacteria group bacterium]|nr:putative lipid II flippase FtsW [Patescibacteria group bacterium]
MINHARKKPDFSIALIVFGLVVLGLVMITSASIVRSYQITEGKSNYYFLVRQLLAFGIGIIFWVIFYNIDFNFWKKVSPYLFSISLILLMLVFFPTIGKNIGGAHRWINLGPLSFQPSEIMKLALILYFAGWLDKKTSDVASFWKTFLPFAAILTLTLFLVMREPDMGTAVILAAIGFGIYFMAGAKLWHLSLFIPIIGIVGWILIKSEPYRWARVIAFINPGKDVLGVSYHINQTLIAIGSGGWWGLGFGNSRQKYNYLPEAHTDSIYAIICEEFGFLRAVLVILAFIFFAIRGLAIVKRAPNNYGRLLASGIIIWFVGQAFINLAVMLGFLPFTGVPLPFISFGGTSLVISLAAVGILMNISKHTVEKKH